MVVVIRLDLDKMSLQQIEKLVLSNLVKMEEAMQSAPYLRLDSYQQLVWKRSVMSVMTHGVVAV